MLKLTGLEEHGNAIKMNLLAKSGLSDNRVMRDLNILESSVSEAAHHMRADGLLPSTEPALRYWTGSDMTEQKAGGRLHHSRSSDDERCNAPPANQQRRLAFRHKRPFAHQERGECRSEDMPRMGADYAPRLPSGAGACALEAIYAVPRRRARQPDWSVPCITSPQRQSA